MIQARGACQAHCAQALHQLGSWGGGGGLVLAVGLPTPDICHQDLPMTLMIANLFTDRQLKAASLSPPCFWGPHYYLKTCIQ